MCPEFSNNSPSSSSSSSAAAAAASKVRQERSPAAYNHRRIYDETVSSSSSPGGLHDYDLYPVVPLDLSDSSSDNREQHSDRHYRTLHSESRRASSVSIPGDPLEGRINPSVWWEQHLLPQYRTASLSTGPSEGFSPSSSFMPSDYLSEEETTSSYLSSAANGGGDRSSSPVSASRIVSFKTMPRVVENQREKFEGDAYFRRLSRESEVRYAAVPIERPIEQRRRQFETDVANGFLIVSFLTSGTHMMLTFRNPRNVPEAGPALLIPGHDRDLSVAEIRNNQLFLQCRMILNGVCVIWSGHIDMLTLDGLGRLDFDAAAADVEIARAQAGVHPRR
ncbi:putative Core-binding factor subunit beta [Hypsibius exemplaris]|uniref:Core-binding factor subunit beta n=1 Tax=Hypsibius exemplaris TaxID=2072580 RepID=A0A1W0WTI1_HYPEX|nr:putative Core-binding factor subunit beta [Hypsibius exemplaris]